MYTLYTEYTVAPVTFFQPHDPRAPVPAPIPNSQATTSPPPTLQSLVPRVWDLNPTTIQVSRAYVEYAGRAGSHALALCGLA